MERRRIIAWTTKFVRLTNNLTDGLKISIRTCPIIIFTNKLLEPFPPLLFNISSELHQLAAVQMHSVFRRWKNA